MAGRSGIRRSSDRWTFALAAGWLLAAPAAMATTIEVTHLVDDTITTNGTCTLREAVRAANGNVAVDACPAGQSSFRDEIIVKPGVHRVTLVAGAGEDLAVTGDLDLRGAVRIRGASSRYSIIDGSGVGVIDRLFHVHDVADDVVFEGVAHARRATPPSRRSAAASSGTRRRGRTTSSSSRSRSRAASPRAAAEIFNEGNLRIAAQPDRRQPDDGGAGDAGNHGGGIASAGPSAALRIEDCELQGNHAEEDGAGVWIGGGTFVVHRSQITDNVAGNAGGGLAIATNGYEVQYVEFAGNQAAVGGGVHLADQGEIQRSAFIANQATVRGGGLPDVGGGFARFSTFTQNVSPLGARRLRGFEPDAARLGHDREQSGRRRAQSNAARSSRTPCSP